MRNNIFTILVLCLVILGISSCSKEPVSDTQGDVQFFFDGTIGTNAVLFEAGNNNYFMHTDFTDNGATDVLLMQGAFLDKNDTSDNYLRFEFYGYDSTNNSDVLQNSFGNSDIFSLSKDSIGQAAGAYTVAFKAAPNNSFASYVWDFGDISTGTGDSVVHTYPPNVSVANVTLTAAYQQPACTETVVNTIDFGKPTCNVSYTITPLGFLVDSFRFEASPGFTSYSWDFGDGSMATGNIVTHGFTDSLMIPKIVQLTAVNPICTTLWKSVVTPQTASCMANFSYNVLSGSTGSSSIRAAYNSCVITYKNNGQVYSSFINDNRDQSWRKVFTLNQATAYQNNAAGQSTIQLLGAMNTQLYNVNNPNDSISINSSKISIAIAHP